MQHSARPTPNLCLHVQRDCQTTQSQRNSQRTRLNSELDSTAVLCSTCTIQPQQHPNALTERPAPGVIGPSSALQATASKRRRDVCSGTTDICGTVGTECGVIRRQLLLAPSSRTLVHHSRAPRHHPPPEAHASEPCCPQQPPHALWQVVPASPCKQHTCTHTRAHVTKAHVLACTHPTPKRGKAPSVDGCSQHNTQPTNATQARRMPFSSCVTHQAHTVTAAYQHQPAPTPRACARQWDASLQRG